MRLHNFYLKEITFAFFVFAFFSCNAWQDDIQLTDANLDKNLNEIIKANSEISRFDSILQVTGYDELLNGNQTLTVFAPTNDAIKNLDVSDVEYLKLWVKNYIAFLPYYLNSSGSFSSGKDKLSQIEMLNGKIIPINIAGIVKQNIAGKNGVLHIINYAIPFRKNILEYMLEQQGYDQIDFIKSLQERVMDKEKSIQTGVDKNGQPIFDTVWTEKNTYLEALPLDNEQNQYTVILLDNSALNLIKAKYAKYMKQSDLVKQSKDIMFQLASDLVLNPVEIKNAGRFSSVTDVLVDIDPVNITATYQASNGIVYKLTAADIKIYENKIKTRIIEGEDFSGSYDGQNAWTVRYRSRASGGKDAVLKGQTKWTFEWDVHYPPKDSVAHKTSTKTFIYTGDAYVQSKSTNAYIQFNPIMYSCDYEMSWMAYDDVTNHYFTIPDSVRTMPMMLEQKLLISFPGQAELKRDVDGKIRNNFSSLSVMAAISTAGKPEEIKLVRYRTNADNTTAGSSVEKLYLLDIVSDGTDAFGSGSIIKCPAYGTATFFVANTVRRTVADAGLIFLDYIKLTPKVDIND
jgi:hypothetical protein